MWWGRLRANLCLPLLLETQEFYSALQQQDSAFHPVSRASLFIAVVVVKHVHKWSPPLQLSNCCEIGSTGKIV